MAVVVPVAVLPALTEEVTLDGIPLRLGLAWNDRAAHWSLSFFDRDGNPLVEGIRVVPYYELIRQFPGRGLPPGELVAMDPSLQLRTIGRDDLGTVVQFVYTPEAELAAV